MKIGQLCCYLVGVETIMFVNSLEEMWVSDQSSKALKMEARPKGVGNNRSFSRS